MNIHFNWLHKKTYEETEKTPHQVWRILPQLFKI
jgi:hypothetical protein